MQTYAPPRSRFQRRWSWNRRAELRGFYNAWLRGFQRVLMHFHIEGLEHVPPRGGAIVAINHINFWDPLVVMPSLGRDVIPMTKVEAWESALRVFVHYYGAIPVHRGAVDTAAVRAASEALQVGYLVLISPEGTRSPTGALQRAQDGMAFLAVRTDAPILPVAIQGTPDIFPALRRLSRARVHVRVGEPFRLPASSPRPDRHELEQLTDYAMRRLAALLPPHMRGFYA